MCSLILNTPDQTHYTTKTSLFSHTAARRARHLFPYTTLFRSRPRGVCGRVARDGRARAGVPARHGLGAERSSRATRDRKSTRLNSSHSSISYAVFCLKKKNKINKQSKYKASYCTKQISTRSTL